MIIYQNQSKGTRMINELPTAFPWSHKDVTCTGMTLRDYFAAKAMQALLTDPDISDTSVTKKVIALSSYSMADEMMKAREL